MTFEEQYHSDKLLIDQSLGKYFSDSHAAHKGLLEAMRYSLLAGGKRLRPILVLETCRACGGEPEAALPVACALEMLHTYTLIHDDLPCMDNDTLRRGRPTCHMAFGECVATLAGDALQAEAFGAILSSQLPAEIRAECAAFLAEAAGEKGICGGQFMDTVARDQIQTIQALEDMYQKKTGALFRAACGMGASCARAKAEFREVALHYAECLGLAFQIRDDVLDAVGTCEMLGKNVGSDAREGKHTFLSLYGRTACERTVHELTNQAIEAISSLPSPEFLISLAQNMAARSK